MAETMIASGTGITDGQIETAADQLRAAMRKHRSEVSKESAQQALGVDNLGMRMFTLFREIAEATSGIVSRRVSVNRSRKPEEAIKATGRIEYLNGQVVKTMPKGEGEDVEVHFFNLGRYVSDADLDREYELRGLKPADPYALAAINEADPSFTDKHPNGTHWKDAKGNWCYAAFGRWSGKRKVSVNMNGHDWFDFWWFAGVRK